MGIIDNYWIKTYKSGIVCILFNTKDRWINYDINPGISMTPTGKFYTFVFGNNEIVAKTVVLPLIDGSYLRFSKQEKDQISWYFVPYKLFR